VRGANLQLERNTRRCRRLIMSVFQRHDDDDGAADGGNDGNNNKRAARVCLNGVNSSLE
jgi:hypothetical protein